jgi:hypothetical protein
VVESRQADAECQSAEVVAASRLLPREARITEAEKVSIGVAGVDARC